jgi:predicted transposase YbfD/YdcC
VLGQEAVEEKSNEITAIPALLDRIDFNDAWCRSALSDAIRTLPNALSMPS